MASENEQHYQRMRERTPRGITGLATDVLIGGAKLLKGYLGLYPKLAGAIATGFNAYESNQANRAIEAEQGALQALGRPEAEQEGRFYNEEGSPDLGKLRRETGTYTLEDYKTQREDQKTHLEQRQAARQQKSIEKTVMDLIQTPEILNAMLTKKDKKKSARKTAEDWLIKEMAAGRVSQEDMIRIARGYDPFRTMYRGGTE